MSTPTERPERIKPFYYTPEPGQTIPLFEEGGATLTQGDLTKAGALTIAQEWSPMRLTWGFSSGDLAGLKFDEVEIVSKSLHASGRLLSKENGRVGGLVQGPVEIGSDHKLDRVTFHLHNYPDLFGGGDYDDCLIVGDTKTHIRWSEVVLEAEGWHIRLQPLQSVDALNKRSREQQKAVLSGVGEIRKTDSSQFKKKHVAPLLEALRIFLSFSFAEWSPPLLAVGSNQVVEKSCQFWRNYDVSPRQYAYLKGWLDERHGQFLAAAFPGFMARWMSANWREPLELAVTWLVEASRQSGGIEGAVAFSQIPLEMLAWLVFVDDKSVVESGEFEKLSAASKLQMLLAHCDIPFDVPPKLSAMSTLAENTNFKTGPQIITKVRNAIIHSHKKNRDQLASWESQFPLKIADIRRETHQLFKWYMTLVLLNLTGYSGKYANRLTPHILGNIETVPWALSK
jgi:hypothetical protein